MEAKMKGGQLKSSVSSLNIISKMLNNVFSIPFPLKNDSHNSTKVSVYLLDEKPGILFCYDSIFVLAGSFCYRNGFHNAIWIFEKMERKFLLLAKIESPALRPFRTIKAIKQESSLIRSRMKKYMNILSSQGHETMWSTIKRDFPGWKVTIY